MPCSDCRPSAASRLRLSWQRSTVRAGSETCRAHFASGCSLRSPGIRLSGSLSAVAYRVVDIDIAPTAIPCPRAAHLRTPIGCHNVGPDRTGLDPAFGLLAGGNFLRRYPALLPRFRTSRRARTTANRHLAGFYRFPVAVPLAGAASLRALSLRIDIVPDRPRLFPIGACRTSGDQECQQHVRPHEYHSH